MKIMLIFSLFSISLLATLPAHAGAASGCPAHSFRLIRITAVTPAASCGTILRFTAASSAKAG